MKKSNMIIKVIAVIVVLGIIGSFMEAPEDKKQSTDTSSKTETKEQTKVPKTTTDKLWVAVDDTLNSREGVDVEFDEAAGMAILTHSGGAYWNEKDTIGSSYRQFVGYGKKAFEIEGVNSLRYTALSVFTDSYGKESNEAAVTIEMSKESFEKFNWSNLKGRPIHQQIREEGILSIHPAIQKNVRLDEVKY